jgi:hypothetical protein
LVVKDCAKNYESIIECFLSGRITNLKDLISCFPGEYKYYYLYLEGTKTTTDLVLEKHDYYIHLDTMPKKGEAVGAVIPKKKMNEFLLFLFDVETGEITLTKHVTKTFWEMYESGEISKRVLSEYVIDCLDQEIFLLPGGAEKNVGPVIEVFYDHGVLDSTTVRRLFRAGRRKRGKSKKK